MSEYEIITGDCSELLRELPNQSIDSVVTDPPYELGFMGKKWDATGIAYSVDLWREVLRVLKPGGHLLAFGGTRTYHRMACAIEDAGFEVRDSLHWIYGTGFPKSVNLGEGRGSALKPGHEPIVMARKPLTGTLEANVTQWGTGGLNIDGCRIEGEKRDPGFATSLGQNERRERTMEGGAMARQNGDGLGRFPANVLFDEDAAAELDAQSEGTRGASRFFYVAKPSRKERDLGCERLPARDATQTVGRELDSAGAQNPRAGAGCGAGTPIYRCRLCGLNLGGGRAASKCSQDTGVHDPIQIGVYAGARNYHPTVKPIQLMRYLVRLVTPPGGVVLDPFTGSGTTGVAAVLEERKFLGFELDAGYAAIADARVKGVG